LNWGMIVSWLPPHSFRWRLGTGLRRGSFPA